MRGHGGYLIPFLLLPLVAWWWPDPGLSDGILNPCLTTPLALITIFLWQGWQTDPSEFQQNLCRWRAHLLCQGLVFVAMPLLAIAFLTACPWWMASFPSLRSGILILSALPTTVASCTVFTRDARGNSTLALLNTTLNNLIGIVITPLLLLLTVGYTIFLNPLGLSLRLVLGTGLPFILGLGLRRWVRVDPARWPTRIALLFIQYTSLCQGIDLLQKGDHALSVVLHTFAVAIPWFVLATLISYGLAKMIGLEKGDVRACTFVGAQKTLAVGTPVIHWLVPQGGEVLTLGLLPLLIYYYVQMIGAIALADYWGDRRSSMK